MTSDLSQQLTSPWSAFWSYCARLLTIYPQRPAAMSREAEVKQLERQLISLGNQLAPTLCPSDYWQVAASVGKGNWASIPWVAFFDTRQTRSGQQGVYPVIHFSPDSPVGIRLGLGIAAAAYRGREDEKAASVSQQLGSQSHQQLSDAGFINAIGDSPNRTPIGTGNRSLRYNKGMIVERFVTLEDLQESSAELTTALQTLLTTYQRWVDQQLETSTDDDSGVDFLTLMREYADERVVFMSPSRESRFCISDVDDRGCTVQRLDSESPARATLSAFKTKLALIKSKGGETKRDDIDGTIAIQVCYLQAPELGLKADRQTAVAFESDQQRADHFIELIHSMQFMTLYKPVILTLVIEAIRDGELVDNRISFDWLLPMFIARMRSHGKEVGEQQLAHAFGRLASDLFWLLAHHDTNELLDVSAPTPARIRERVSHARLQEAYWQMLQDDNCSEQVLAAIKNKWWPDNIVIERNPETDLAKSTEKLIQAIAAKGFTFHPWHIATYITAMRTKPFVILAGVSGTGKSKLPALIAELTTGKMDRVSVRPDWTDSSDVLGYVDLQDRFRAGVVLAAARIASTDTEQFHVCLLDEMNLARVEHYFAEVLSAIEDRRSVPTGGYESTKLIAQTLPTEYRQWQEQTMPANFGIVGTVNMDESSQGFSRKVLDRAFTLELSEVDLDLDQSTSSSEPVSPVYWPPAFWYCRATRIAECDQTTSQFREAAERATEVLKSVNQCLVHSQLQVGYRTRDEVILFLMNAQELKASFRTRGGASVDPLDLALMMKVLPRLVGGSNAIRRTMIGLLGLAHGKTMTESDAEAAVASWGTADRPDAIAEATFPRTASRLCLMWERLISEGYTSFWL